MYIVHVIISDFQEYGHKTTNNGENEIEENFREITIGLKWARLY